MRWIVVLALAAGCVESSSVICNGRVCPSDSRCDEATGVCIPPTCGNGIIDPNEDCDGPLTQDCTDYGYYGKDGLACSAICTIDTSGCGATCGDRVINGPELCDGIPPSGRTCADFGFDIGRLGCSSACTPGFGSCSYVGWHSMAGGANAELYGVSGTFAVGQAGTILRNTDGVWLPMTSPTTKDLKSVWTSPTGQAYAVGLGGTIVGYDGTTWSVMSSGTTMNLLSVFGTTDSNVYAVGVGGTILHYTGSSWTPMTSGVTVTLRGVWAGGIDAFAVGDSGTVLRNQGGTWAPFTALPGGITPTLFAVFGTQGNLFVAGPAGLVMHHDGAAWNDDRKASIPAVDLLSLWGTSPDDVFVGGAAGTMLHFDEFGLQLMGSNTSRSIFGIWGVGPALVFAATKGGDIIEFTGTDRRTMTALTAFTQLNSVWRTGNLRIAVGDARAIVEFNGNVWSAPLTLAAATSTTTLYSVWANGSLVVIGAADEVTPNTGSGVYVSTAGAGGPFAHPVTTFAHAVYGVASPLKLVATGRAVWQSSDGTTWTQVTGTPNGTNSINGLWATSDGAHWFGVGENGTIMHDDGTGWKLMTSGVTNFLEAVWGASPSDVWAVGRQGTILHYNGTAWRRLYSGTGENLVTIVGTSSDDIFVAGSNGVILHWDGISWTRLSGAPFGDVLDIITTNRQSLLVGQTGGAQEIARTCVAASVGEQRCDDAWDNDCDGKVNCKDEDCADDLKCLRGGACQTSGRLACPDETATQGASTYTGFARVDDFPCLDHSTPGPEASYRYTADKDGEVTVTLTDPSGMLDLVWAPALNSACDVASCKAGTGAAGTKSVTFTAATGATYFFVVDGPADIASDFTLSIACP